MTFPAGKPVLMLMLVAAASGAALLFSPTGQTQKADLRVWVFDASHAGCYRDAGPGGQNLLGLHEKQTRKRVNVSLIPARALDARLISLFQAQRTGHDLPDVVEIEIASTGKFLRGPVGSIPLLPLNNYLRESGLDRRLVANRLATYTKDGVIFGVPADVHPVTITYRRDLFAQAGVDLASAQTWDEFQNKCLAFEAYWREAGDARRRAMELSRSGAGDLMILLLQRGVNLVDADGRLHLADRRVAATMAFYAQMLAGPRAMATPAAAGNLLWARDLAEGRLCAAMTPDWRVRYLKEMAPELAGKVAMMPLPRFEPGDSPTSTWGGTMLAIPRHVTDPDASWRLLEFLLASPDGLAARREHTDILPPLRDALERQRLTAGDAFFGQQPVAALYAELAAYVPANTMQAQTPLASQALAGVLSRAIDLVEAGQTEGLEDACLQMLVPAQMELESLRPIAEDRR